MNQPQKYTKEYSLEMKKTIWYMKNKSPTKTAGSELLPTPINTPISTPTNAQIDTERSKKVEVLDKKSAESQYKIYEIFKSVQQYKTNEYVTRLQSVIKSHFYPDKTAGNKFIKYLIKTLNKAIIGKYLISDLELCKKLKKYMSTNNTIMHTERGSNIAKNILKHIPDVKIESYLDFDCFDCEITNNIKDLLKLNKEQTHGVDIKEYGTKCNSITFKQIPKFEIGVEPIALPYSDNSFDLVTCLMVLHHIPSIHLKFLIHEFNRILRPGGYIILKEHNVANRDVILQYVIDVQHMLFDLVWEQNSENMSWEQNTPINYLSVSKWNEMFLDDQFEIYNSAFYNSDLVKNPTNKFVIVYSKSKPILNNQVSSGGLDFESKYDNDTQKENIYHPIYRKMTFDMPRKVYYSRRGEIKNTKHMGQRKLFLTELEFLTLYFTNNPIINKKKKYIVVYAGAAPGTHDTLLTRMFDMVDFELYDPRPFDPKLKDCIRIHTHQEYFTDQIAEKWSSKNNPNSIILFISDIRTADPSEMRSDEVEKRVVLDHEMQARWYRIMEPAFTMFKFRLPWDNNITSYLKGDIYIQPYPPLNSTETRLIINGGHTPNIDYDDKAYEEILFHHNTDNREKEYKNILQDIPSSEKCDLDNKYDCVSEIEIISSYLRLKGKKIDVKRICQISEDITRNIPGRKLGDIQPLKKNQKTHIQILKNLHHIPRDAPINKETYDKYVIPKIEEYIEKGILNI
jgi:SAM-dependent methyltransferase